MNRRKFIGLIVPVVLLALWHFASLLNLVPSYLLPSPYGIFKIGWDFINGSMNLTPYSGTFYIHFLASIARVLAGFLIASIFGISLGYASARSNKFNELVNPFINGLKAVPGIGWLPLALVWFGVGQKTTIFLISLASFFPVYINVCAGAAKVPEIYIKSAKMMGATNFEIFYTVIIPGSVDSLVTGLRLALGVSWAYLVLGEITGVSEGLGAVMMDARMLGNIDVVLMSMVIIAILGWTSDHILVEVFRIVSKIKGRRYAL